jgi:hypothetical protein
MPAVFREAEESAEGEAASPAGARLAWVRWIVIALWLPLVLAAIAAPIAGPLLSGEQHAAGEAYDRVGLSSSAPFRPISRAAIDAGVRWGDEVIAVDGVRLTGGAASGPTSELAALLGGADGTTVRLLMRSADGSLREHRLTRSDAHLANALASAGIAPPLRAWFFYLISLVSSLALALAAVLLFVRGRGRRVPSLLSFGLAILSLAPNLDFFGTLGPAMRQPMLATGFTLVMLALMLFPDGTFYPRWMRWTALALLAVTPLGVFRVITTGWPVLHSAFLVLSAISLVLRYRHLPAGAERQQIRWTLFGFGVAAFLMVPTQFIEFVILPSSVPLPAWIWSQTIRDALNIILLLAVAGGLIVSLLRYRLYDADAVIVRSVSFGALALLLLALFAGTERIIELLGEHWFGERLGVLAGGMGAAVAALMVVPLHHRLSHWAEHKFQKELIALRTGLPALMGDMRETAPVARIAAAALDRVAHGVRSSRAALLFDGLLLDARGTDTAEVEAWRAGWSPLARGGIETDRDDPLFPLRVPLAADGHGRLGWLLLGPRPDGSLYGKDERETLAAIADPIARALEIAAAREKRETEERERWRAQEGLNAQIKAVNSELVRVLGSLDEKLGLMVQLPPAAAAE